MFIVFLLFQILMLRKPIISTFSGERCLLSLITIRTRANTDVPDTKITVCALFVLGPVSIEVQQTELKL